MLRGTPRPTRPPAPPWTRGDVLKLLRRTVSRKIRLVEDLTRRLAQTSGAATPVAVGALAPAAFTARTRT